jgi:hypothetical protein
MTDPNVVQVPAVPEIMREVEAPKRAAVNPDLLDQVFAASTPVGGAAMAGGELFHRKRVTFEVPKHYCTVDFPTNFDLTIIESTPQQEMAVAAIASNGNEVQYLLAKHSMDAVNGKKIGETKRDWLWEALGSRGRTLVVGAYSQHLGVGPEGKEEYVASILGAKLE